MNNPALGGVPRSCYCPEGSLDGCMLVGSDFVYGEGCYTKLGPWLVGSVDALGGLAFGVAVLDVRRTHH